MRLLAGLQGERLQRRTGDLVTYYGEWDSYPNRRPTYPSSMNYPYYGTVYWNADAEQFVSTYDYSRADLPDLDESDLNERPDSDFVRALREYPIPSNLDEAPSSVADDWVPVVRYACLSPRNEGCPLVRGEKADHHGQRRQIRAPTDRVSHPPEQKQPC